MDCWNPLVNMAIAAMAIAYEQEVVTSSSSLLSLSIDIDASQKNERWEEKNESWKEKRFGKTYFVLRIGGDQILFTKFGKIDLVK
jgi:hypothetical protein